MARDDARDAASRHGASAEPRHRGSGGDPSVRVRAGRMRLDAPDAADQTADHAPTERPIFDYRAVQGIIPTVLVPFDDADEVDTDALRAEIEYLLEAGVHGLLVLGSFGECAYLSDKDREAVIRTAVDCAGPRVPVIAGITAASTRVAAEHLRQAKRIGAAAVMVCLPQYFRVTFEQAKHHYASLSELESLPIFYYHYPTATRLHFKADQIAELLSLPNVVGIKETIFDMLAVRRHIQLTRELDRIYLSGSELNFTQFMDLGGHGVVSAGSLVMPRTAVAMYDAYRAGDRSKAKELQAIMFETMPLAKDTGASIPLVRTAFLLALRQGLEVHLGIEPTIARLKAALARRGVPISPRVRDPLPQLTARDAKAVEQAIERIETAEKSIK